MAPILGAAPKLSTRDRLGGREQAGDDAPGRVANDQDRGPGRDLGREPHGRARRPWPSGVQMGPMPRTPEISQSGVQTFGHDDAGRAAIHQPPDERLVQRRRGQEAAQDQHGGLDEPDG